MAARVAGKPNRLSCSYCSFLMNRAGDRCVSQKVSTNSACRRKVFPLPANILVQSAVSPHPMKESPSPHSQTLTSLPLNSVRGAPLDWGGGRFFWNKIVCWPQKLKKNSLLLSCLLGWEKKFAGQIVKKNSLSS